MDKDRTLYLGFAEALTKANASGEDVTIELLSDITITNNKDIMNVNGKAITIDGNHHTVTTTGQWNTFRVMGPQTCVFELKNMTIDHRNSGAVIQVRDEAVNATLNLANVAIDATKGENYEYALINLLPAGGRSTLNLIEVDVTMAVAGKGMDNFASVIRTGNAGDKKTVNINLTDCNLDTTGAAGRSGIAVMKGTSAAIDLKNTKIQTKDIGPIMDYAEDTQIGKTDCLLGAKDYVAQTGVTLYTDFDAARKAANESDKDVAIELLSDITLTNNKDFMNANGRGIIIDGNGHTVTTTGQWNTFRVTGPQTCVFELKNMTIDHQNSGAVVQVRDRAVNTTLNLTNVVIDATKGEKYEYALINLLPVGGMSTLNLTGVDVTMAVDSKGQDDCASVIRTGNHGDKKAVNINLTDCNLDTAEAAGRSGIMVMKDTKAVINMKNSNIKTKDTYTIRAAQQGDVQSLTMTGCELSSLTEEYANNPIQNIDSDNIIVNQKETVVLENVSPQKEESATRKLILDVPIRLYDAFVDWIKQFARMNGWNLEL